MNFGNGCCECARSNVVKVFAYSIFMFDFPINGLVYRRNLIPLLVKSDENNINVITPIS